MNAMKTMIYSFLMAAAAVTPLVGCSDNDDVVEQRDWSTTTLFASSDVAAQDIYYKPQSGYVGDPMPFYDPVAKDFKILYLQDYRPNPVGTYHPIWAVSTTDAASYTSLGEIIPCAEGKKLVCIITNRDLKFETDFSKKIKECMTSEGLITAK